MKKFCQYFEVGKDGREIMPANGEDFSLEELQTLVGGAVQIVPLNRGRILVCADDAYGQPRNDMASLACVGQVFGDEVYGNCLICDSSLVK